MASKAVARVLEGLGGFRPLSNGYSALCPVHDDYLLSLSIAEGGDGRAVLFCHAGCDIDDVIAAMGLRARDVFVQRKRRTRK